MANSTQLPGTLVMESDNDNDILPDEVFKKVFSEHALFIMKGIFNAVLTQGLCVLGSVTNILNMIVFYRMGFNDTINITLMALSVSDLGSCFVFIWRNIAMTPWFQQIDDLPFETNEIPYLISLIPHIMFVEVSKLLTAFITFERCLCVTMPLKVKSIITKNVVKAYCILSYLIIVPFYTPVYSTRRYDWKFSLLRNKTLYGLVYSNNAAEVNTILYPILTVCLSIVPFSVIIISTIFLVVSLQKNMKWRQKATTDSSKSSNKENKIVKMVVTISVLFIACFIPYAVSLVVQNVYPELQHGGLYKNAYFAMGAVVFFFESINSSCNIFIYYVSSSVYRNTFDKTFSFRKNKA